jgi:hypothetical protein
MTQKTKAIEEDDSMNDPYRTVSDATASPTTTSTGASGTTPPSSVGATAGNAGVAASKDTGSTGTSAPYTPASSRAPAAHLRAPEPEISDNAIAKHAKAIADGAKEEIASRAGKVASAFHKAASELRDEEDALATYADRIGEEVSRASHYLRSRGAEDVIDDVAAMANRHPAVFVGGALALGFVLGRFLRASAPAEPTFNQETM